MNQGAPNIAPNAWPVLATAGPANGASKPAAGNPIRNLSAAPVAVKTSSGVLLALVIENNQAATTFVQLFDAIAGNVVLGTTHPDVEYFVAANAMAFMPLPSVGWPFGVALSIAATTTGGGNVGSAAGVNVYPVFA